MISCIDLVKKCMVGVECARANQVVAHLNNNTGNGTITITITMVRVEYARANQVRIDDEDDDDYENLKRIKP